MLVLLSAGNRSLVADANGTPITRANRRAPSAHMLSALLCLWHRRVNVGCVAIPRVSRNYSKPLRHICRSALADALLIGHPVRVTQERDSAPDPIVSVLVDRPGFLATLDAQTLRDVELVTWNDETWRGAIEQIAADHRWPHRRVSTEKEALAAARGRYVVGWGAVEAAPSALTELAERADREPRTRGAIAANNDGVILWRRDEFFAKTGREGLAQANERTCLRWRRRDDRLSEVSRGFDLTHHAISADPRSHNRPRAGNLARWNLGAVRSVKRR
jgi:hypothetical protein